MAHDDSAHKHPTTPVNELGEPGRPEEIVWPDGVTVHIGRVEAHSDGKEIVEVTIKDNDGNILSETFASVDALDDRLGT